MTTALHNTQNSPPTSSNPSELSFTCASTWPFANGWVTRCEVEAHAKESSEGSEEVGGEFRAEVLYSSGVVMLLDPVMPVMLGSTDFPNQVDSLGRVRSGPPTVDPKEIARNAGKDFP